MHKLWPSKTRKDERSKTPEGFAIAVFQTLYPLLTQKKQGQFVGGFQEEEDVRALAKADPIAAISSPDCPVELWWRLAENNPIEAMQSPLYPLLTLESPNTWLDLEKRCTDLHGYEEGWCDTLVRDQMGSHRLSDQAKRLLAVECATKIYPDWKIGFPNDNRPAKVIHQATLYAFGLAALDDLTAASEEAASDPFYELPNAADFLNATRVCAQWAGYFSDNTVSRADFLVWAWRRALEFLFAPNQLPPPWDTFDPSSLEKKTPAKRAKKAPKIGANSSVGAAREDFNVVINDNQHNAIIEISKKTNSTPILLGKIEIDYSGSLAAVTMIRVREDSHREGIATLLYEEAAKLAATHGLPLTSDTFISPKAEGFWKKQVTKGRAKETTVVPGQHPNAFVSSGTKAYQLNYPPPDSLGAKTKMKDDLTLSSSKLENLAKRDKLAALRHPQATREQLHRWLSYKHKAGLMTRLAALEENPALDLMWLLESPPGPDDPFAMDLWGARYDFANLQLKQAAEKVSTPQMIAWAEYEIRAVLPQLAQEYPKEASFIESCLDQLTATAEPRISDLRYAQDKTEEMKKAIRPCDYIIWAFSYWINAWVHALSKHGDAKYSAQVAASYVYHFRFHDNAPAEETPYHTTWQIRQHYTIQLRAELAGLQSFLGKGTVGAKRKGRR